jgi:hypothetical protein
MEDTVASAVTSGLYLVERNLNMIMQMLAHPNERSIMHSTRNDIQSGTKSSMLTIIDSMFAEIGFLKKRFNLRTDEESASWKVHSYVSGIWAIFEDCMPDKLTGYGKMTPQDADALNRHIGLLLQLNDRLLEELRVSPPTNNSHAMPTELPPDASS